MSTRSINLESLELPDERAMAWFQANGVDPGEVPVKQEVLVTDTELTFIQFRRNVEGNKIVSDDGWEKFTRTIPLLSAPENHGL
ncbi:hypothetical protein ASF74_07945 [Arthrobacter sp. Leaf145]|nr:hypothetical protein ASF74_07945 [Arthrobacter sp. Leaf145]